MTKKNLKVSALKHEISTNVEKVLCILIMLNFVKGSTFFVDSEANDWINGEPSESDMNKVLEELGY